MLHLLDIKEIQIYISGVRISDLSSERFKVREIINVLPFQNMRMKWTL